MFRAGRWDTENTGTTKDTIAHLHPQATGRQAKKKPVSGETGLSQFASERLAVRTAAALEAIAAVDGLIAAREERHFGRLTALAAGRLVHLASGSAATAGTTATAVAAAVAAAISAAAGSTLRLTGRTAFRATVGLVLEAFAREKLLFARAKDKLAVAINAVQGFICVQLLGVFLWRLILSNPLEDKMSALRVLTTFYAMFRAGRRDTMSTRPASRTITHSDESWRHFS
jgi:hypothetical protein